MEQAPQFPFENQPRFQPPKKKRNRRTLIGCGIFAALVLVIAIIIAIATSGNPPSASTSGTPTADTSVTRPTAIVPTHGAPLIGGTISDFYGKYGTPNTQGVANAETWFLSSNTVILSARPDAAGKVSYISVSGPATWNETQSIAACTAYLPSGASSFNHAGNLTDYHSSVGEIVLNAPGLGVCTLSIAGA